MFDALFPKVSVLQPNCTELYLQTLSHCQLHPILQYTFYYCHHNKNELHVQVWVSHTLVKGMRGYSKYLPAGSVPNVFCRTHSYKNHRLATVIIFHNLGLFSCIGSCPRSHIWWLYTCILCSLAHCTIQYEFPSRLNIYM